MTQIQWGILGAARDPGQAFTEGMERGQAMRMESDKRNALSAYAQNPQDANALNALMGIDPMMGMQLQERQRASQAGALEQHRERIGFGARLIEQYQPQDEAGWQQVRAAMAQAGYDISDIPETFDPRYVDGVRQLGRAMNPQPVAKPTALQQNYEFLSSQDPELGQKYIRRQAEGSPFIMVNGVPHMWTDGGGNEAPPVLTDEDILRMEGGQPGGSSTGGFQP